MEESPRLFWVQEQDLTAKRLQAFSGLISELRGEKGSMSHKDVLQILQRHQLITAETFVAGEWQTCAIACLVTMTLPQGARYLLESFVVAASYQRQGIGSLLIERVLQKVKEDGGKELRLTCNDSRTEAMQFYLKQGFEKVGTSVLRKAV